MYNPPNTRSAASIFVKENSKKEEKSTLAIREGGGSRKAFAIEKAREEKHGTFR